MPGPDSRLSSTPNTAARRGGRARMQEIRFPTHDVTFPAICSCCGKPATHSFKQTKEDLGRLALAVTLGASASASGRASGFAGNLRRNVDIDVPVCLTCKRHTAWEKGGGSFGL